MVDERVGSGGEHSGVPGHVVETCVKGLSGAFLVLDI